MAHNIENRLRERRKIQTTLLIALWVVVLLVITLLCSAQANARMNNKEWSFTLQNRMFIAAAPEEAVGSVTDNAPVTSAEE